MIAPVIDQVVVTSRTSTTSNEAEAKAADILTFRIGLAVVAAVVFVMAVLGAVTASTPLLISAALTGAVAAFAGVYTGVNLAHS